MKQPLRVTPTFLFFVVLILPFVSSQQHSYASAHATAQASAHASADASAHALAQASAQGEARADGTSSAYGGMSRDRGIYDYNGYQANALALARSGAQFGGRLYPSGYRQMENGALVGDRYEMNGEPFSYTGQNMNGIIPYDTGNHATSSASAANAENAASSANEASASGAASAASVSANSFASSGGRIQENRNMFSRNGELVTGGIYPGFQRNGGVFAGSYNWGGMQTGREFQTHTHSGFHRFSPHDEILMHREMSSAGGLAGGKISSIRVTRVGEGMPAAEGMQTGRAITTKIVRTNGDATSEKGLETVEVTKKLTNDRISSKDGMLLTEREAGLEALGKLIDSLSSRRRTNSSLLLADRHTLEKKNKPVVLKRTTTITTNITLQSRIGHSKPGALHVIEKKKHTNKTEELVNKTEEEEVTTGNSE